MLDSFIPIELAVAPNPLGLAPHLKLTAIPVDAYNCFELWVPTTDQSLLPEEAMLLMGDCSRIEDICARLIWLLGAQLEWQNGPVQAVQDWPRVKQQLGERGLKVDAIGVDYLPQNVSPLFDPEGLEMGWTLHPASWQLTFIAFKPGTNSYSTELLPVTVSIAAGQAITRTSPRLACIADRL